MTSTETILQAARDLGKQIAKHDAAVRLEQAMKKLDDNVDAQRLLNDYNRSTQSIAQKETEGKPIEVEDKHKLKQLQDQVMGNALLGQLQMAQMDYLDLMRRVDQAMSGDVGDAAKQGPASALGDA